MQTKVSVGLGFGNSDTESHKTDISFCTRLMMTELRPQAIMELRRKAQESCLRALDAMMAIVPKAEEETGKYDPKRVLHLSLSVCDTDGKDSYSSTKHSLLNISLSEGVEIPDASYRLSQSTLAPIAETLLSEVTKEVSWVMGEPQTEKDEEG